MLNILIEKIGFSVCHQLPAKSLNIGGIYLPICARCSGIYIGFFIAALILFIMFRKKESNLPPIYILVILCLFIFSTVVDGILSYFGHFETNNNIRFITGFLCGSSIMAIIYPVFVYQYYKKPKDKRIFTSPVKFIIYILLLTVFIVIALFRIRFLGYFFYYLASFSIIFTFYFINLVMIFIIPSFSQKATKLFTKYLFFPSLLSFLLLSLELYLSYKFHQIMLNLAIQPTSVT